MPGGVDGFNDLPTKIGRNVGVMNLVALSSY